MKKSLIAYATWTGITRSVAEEIGKTIDSIGFETTVSNAGKVKSLQGYDLIILGTSIHASRTGKDFRKFLKKFHKTLTKCPTAYFVVCANMMEDNEENRAETRSWLDNTTGKYPDIKPISVGLFSGAVNNESKEYSQLFFIVRKIIDAMKEKMVEDHGKSDFRDWDKIRGWSLEFAKIIR